MLALYYILATPTRIYRFTIVFKHFSLRVMNLGQINANLSSWGTFLLDKVWSRTSSLLSFLPVGVDVDMPLRST